MTEEKKKQKGKKNKAGTERIKGRMRDKVKMSLISLSAV